MSSLQFIITFSTSETCARQVTYSLHRNHSPGIKAGDLMRITFPLPFPRGATSNGCDLDWLATRLSEKLDAVSASVEYEPDPDGHGMPNPVEGGLRFEFWRIFSDGQRMNSAGWQGFLDIFHPGEPPPKDFDALIALALFYRAVCLFLRASDRYIAMNASLAYVFSAWQWYNLVKLALEKAYHNQTIDRGKALDKALQREFALSYRVLTPLLAGERFAYAVRWLYQWRSAEIDSSPLIRERMRLSLAISQRSSLLPLNFDPRKPAGAPGVFTGSRLHWPDARLHTLFTEPHQKDAQAEIRRLISDWLLPRYEFESALRLSYLLRRGNHPVGQVMSWPHWGVAIALILLLWFALVVLMGTAAACGIGGAGWFGPSCPYPQVPDGLWVVPLVQSSLALLPFAALWRLLDPQTLKYFALPRVIGGVFIGYLALALQGDAIKVTAVIWKSPLQGWLVLLAVVVVFLTGGLYLVSDTVSMVRDRDEAFRRAGVTLLSIFTVSAVVGLLVVALTTQAYNDVYTNTGLPLKLLMGPFGWVNVYQYAMFVPLAFFTGLVTHFIFEEKNVTASVWASSQE